MITPSKLIQRFLALTIALVATVFGSNAFATSLTVDLVTCTTNGCGVDQNYGDRVVGTSDATGTYGAEGGDTPNVVVDYVPSGGDNLTHWTTGYNELTNVLYNEQDFADSFEVSFTADVGFEVTLESLDIGNFGGAVSPTISVEDENGLELFSIVATLNASGGDSVLVSPSVSAQTLTLIVNTTGLGNLSDNVGLDNIVFSQQVSPVPLPAAAWLFLSAFGALVGIKRTARKA